MRIKCNIEKLVISELNLSLVRNDAVIIEDNIARSCVELNNAIRLKQVLVLRFKEHENIIRVQSSNDKNNLNDLKNELQQQKIELSKIFEDKLEKIEKLLSEINSKNTNTYVIKESKSIESKEENQEEDSVLQIPIINKILDTKLDTNISKINIQKTKSKTKTNKNVDLLKKMKI